MIRTTLRENQSGAVEQAIKLDGFALFSQQRLKNFWAKVRKTKTCWLWTAAKHSNGCGMFGIGKAPNGTSKIIRAHRYSWMLHHKKGIPLGLEVCHQCDTPLCVRPKHLFLGTHTENVRDCVSKKRHAHGETNGHAKMTEEFVRQLRRRYASGERIEHLRKEVSVSWMTAYRAATRRTWKHVR